jgi:hypothetical protein
MFDQLKGKYLVCGLDNLYNSVRFCRDAFTGNNEVLVHGVARKNGRGLPKCVIQEEVENKNLQAKVRGTTKAAVLEGDSECPDIVAFSVYDIKPVNFLSTACSSRFDRWMRKCKWWWPIWMWGLQVLLVNAYVLYRSAHLLIWKTDKTKLLTQYEFRKSIVLDWFGVAERATEDAASSKSSGTGNNRKRSHCDSTLSSLTIDNSFKRATRVTEGSLDPFDGVLRIRLDENVEHYPVLSRVKRPCCSLCRLVAPDKNHRVYHHVYSCDKCSVDLCIPCFRPFHTISSVQKLI